MRELAHELDEFEKMSRKLESEEKEFKGDMEELETKIESCRKVIAENQKIIEK